MLSTILILFALINMVLVVYFGIKLYRSRYLIIPYILMCLSFSMFLFMDGAWQISVITMSICVLFIAITIKDILHFW